jgi:iron(III) transport system ATP-binding protein
MMLIIDHVVVRFGKKLALDDVSLDVARGEVLCLLGPSGSGKSTLLRTVAGIDHPSSGRISMDGIEVSGPGAFVEPEKRRVGMVFQDYALFPHLTVTANVAFGVGKDHGAAIAGLIDRLELRGLVHRYPHELSGGECQRVALARAMAPGPRVLLMDEPFSSLDSRLRADVRRHTLDFIRESETTAVIVTHDPDEAMRIGDRIALLDNGRLVQTGPPEELYSSPSTLAAARFFSDVTPLAGTCREGRVETVLGSFPAPALPAGSDAVVCIRPQHLRIAAEPTGLTARVLSSEYCGDGRYILVRIQGLESPVALRTSPGTGALDNGMTIHLEIDQDDVPVISSGDFDKELIHAQPTLV